MQEPVSNRKRTAARVALVCAWLVLGALPGRAAYASVSADLAAALQPLRALATSPGALAPALRGIAVHHAKGRFAAACSESEALRAKLMREGARLFYAPDRKSADIHGIERYLDHWVRGPTPVLEIPSEVFTPAAGFRALGVESCVRAGKPDLALGFLAGSGGGDDASVRIAIAVVLAQRAGSWQAALPALAPGDQGMRALLVRALAAGPRDALRLADSAARAAVLPAEHALVMLVRQAVAARGAP